MISSVLPSRPETGEVAVSQGRGLSTQSPGCESWLCSLLTLKSWASSPTCLVGRFLHLRNGAITGFTSASKAAVGGWGLANELPCAAIHARMHAHTHWSIPCWQHASTVSGRVLTRSWLRHDQESGRGRYGDWAVTLQWYKSKQALL